MAGLLGEVRTRVRPFAYRSFGALAPGLRRAVVAVFAPSFTVGALAVLHDGELVLFVRQLHRTGLSLPGGLLKRGEEPLVALRRELEEEIGLAPDLAPAPDTANVDPGKRRVDLIWFVAVDRAALAVRTGNEVLSYEWRPLTDPELTPQTQEILAGVASRLPTP